MEIEVLVPDIGDFDAVDVIDVLVKPGDLVNAEDSLITLESDKATMDIPSPRGGKVTSIGVKLGDKVAEGARILTLTFEDGTAPAAQTAPAGQSAPPPPSAPPPSAVAEPPATTAPVAAMREVRVPDLGDFPEVDVIEILVKPGDIVSAEAPLLTLESDKATMDIPAPFAGTVSRVLVKTGDKVSTGTTIVELTPADDNTPAASMPAASMPAPTPASPTAAPAATEAAIPPSPATVAPPPPSAQAAAAGGHVYASPAMRRLARELGVDLREVKGGGRKGRIQREDVVAHVKRTMESRQGAGGGFSLPPAPVVDFSRFGATETQPLAKIRRATGQNLHRSWVTIPHVTQFDEADITELEAFRKAQADAASAAGVKLTLLAFIVKAVIAALAKYPDFNASLTPDGEALVYKKYFNIGIAANTPRGLVVPVLRDAERKGMFQLAGEVREMALKARDGKLAPADMQGACFTISSLGGVSGTAFTPIINPPEVAILGVSPAAMKPVWRNGAFEPRLMLPLSLSYDHRVIDGVAAAEFTRYLGEVLGDIRTLLL
jgi:pyruvate dehydrogenase E2 component (dihydrolipoamide acetyltransferase)